MGAIIFYVAGEPVAAFVIAQGNKIIVSGAPVGHNSVDPKMSKLVMNQRSTPDLSEIQVPELGTQYGTITCEAIALSVPVYYGDSEDILLKGVGQYPNGVLPGYGKPFLISGHDATYFTTLEQIQIGDLLTITTVDGINQYSVTTKTIAEATDTTAYDLTQDKEQMILYTCYPFGQLVGDRSKRFFVYCDPVSDTDIE